MDSTTSDLDHSRIAREPEHRDVLTAIAPPPEMAVITVVLSREQHTRLEIAANYTEATTSFLLRRAVDEVIERRFTSLNETEFEQQLYDALLDGAVADQRPSGDGQTVGVRVPAETKQRIDWLAKALQTTTSALVREGLHNVLDRELGDHDVDSLRRIIASRLAKRAMLYRNETHDASGADRRVAGPDDAS